MMRRGAHITLSLLVLLSTFCHVPVCAASCRGYYVNITDIAITPEWPAYIPTNISICGEDRYPQWTKEFTCVDMNQTTFNLSRQAHCGTIYNKDYYGAGVRIGFYFAWWASFIANNFVPAEIAGAIDANSTFLFALAISVLKGTFYDRNFLTVDAVIVLLIGIGTTVGTMSIWGYRTCLYRLEGRNALSKFGGFGTHSRVVLCFCVNLYWLWFWYHPFRRRLGRPSCDPRCQIVWIFGRPVSDGIRFLLFVFGLLYQIYWGFMLFGFPITILARLGRIRENLTKSQFDRTSKVTYKTGLSHKQLKNASIGFATFDALWFCFVIAAVEVAIHQNSAISVYTGSPQTSTPSQLIPLLIGITTFTRIAYLALKTMRYGNNDIDPSLSEEQELRNSIKDNESWDHDPPASLWQWFYVQSPKYRYRNSRDKEGQVKQQQSPVEDSRRFAEVHWSRRLLVTWLPWLGLIKGFLGEQKLEDLDPSLIGEKQHSTTQATSSGGKVKAQTIQI